MMRQFALLVMCFVMIGLCGCGGTRVREGVTVLLPEGGKLPKNIEGVWKTQDPNNKWEVHFDRYGNAMQAVHHMSGAVIRPEETTVKPLVKVEGKEIYNSGQWTMDYSPDARKLKLEMKIDFVTEDCPAHIEGTLDETLEGAFNEDFTEWHANWYNDSVLTLTEPISGRSSTTDTPDDKRFRGKLRFIKSQ